MSTSQLSSLHCCSLRRVQQVRGSHVQRRLEVRCCIQEQKVNVKKNQDLNLPLQSKLNDVDMKTLGDLSPEDVKETLKAAREKFGRTTVTKALQEAKRKLGKQGVAKLTLFGGVAAVGVFLSGALLTSLEVLPLVPEAMQTVGLAYSVLVASRVIRGTPEKFQVSPVRAVLEIVEEGQKKVQRTSLVMPQDLDKGTVAAMERLARERDMALNQVEEMKRQTAEYSQVLAEKEALETVALQLAEERETAMMEVNALKSAVESMSERMKGIEAMLEKEVGQLKSQNQALETVALQLAQERNVALEETKNFKARSEAEKQALEEVAMQLARERDDALAELDSLRKMVANMGNNTTELTHAQDLFIESRVKDIRTQLQDGHVVPPQQDINSLISHVVDEFEVQPPAFGP